MKTFIQALDIIDNATAVSVDGNELLYPMVDMDDENPYIRIDSEHGDPLFIYAKDNKHVVVDEVGQLVFIDENGNDCRLLPLIAAPVK